MKIRSNDFRFHTSLSEPDQSLLQIEKRLEIQIKPIAQWFKQIDHLYNEVDTGIATLLAPEEELMQKNLYQQHSKLPRQPLHSHQQSGEGLQHTIEQLQALALEAQKEVAKLKLQIQKDTSTIGPKQL